MVVVGLNVLPQKMAIRHIQPLRMCLKNITKNSTLKEIKEALQDEKNQASIAKIAAVKRIKQKVTVILKILDKFFFPIF